MIVSDTAVKNRISVVVLALIILASGVYCYLSLPRESSPDITIPYVFVSTSYKGVSSADIETGITIPIEKKLKGLDRVKKIKSISSEGLSQINIEFIPKTEIDEVLRKVKDKVDEAMGDLPQDLENDPAVFEINISEMPIVTFALSGTCGIARLKRIGDDLADDIEQNTSGGSITLGDGRFQLRVPGEFQTPEEIYNLVVSSYQGRPVYLKDLARVVDGFEEETGRSRLDGDQAVTIAVKKRVGENIIFITDAVDELIARRAPTWPQGTTITKLMDQAKEIRDMVADLENNIITGLLLVVVVLFFALGARNAILVSLSIPFSMLLSFIVLYALGITLNMVVLFSLTLALGMLVDNAIVIIENVYRYMEQGVPRVQAAMRATGEVAWPVIGSTFTTLAAFFPMVFWPGIMGEFMSYLPITLVITLSSSLFVAMIINPALAAYFMRIKRRSPSSSPAVEAAQVSAAGEQPVQIRGWLLIGYTRLLKMALRHRITVLAASFGVLVLLIMGWVFSIGLEKPVEFFPTIDPNAAYINFKPPEGADLDYVDRIVKTAEMVTAGALRGNDVQNPQFSDYESALAMKPHTTADGKDFEGPSDMGNIEHIYAKVVETAGSRFGFEGNQPNHIGLQFVDLVERKRSSAETLEEIRRRMKPIAGAQITVSEQEGGPPTGAPINIEISGEDFKTLGKLARGVREIVSQVPFVEDVQDDYVEGLPSVRVHIDRQKAAIFGFSTNAIGFALKTAYNGLDVSTFREQDEDYDITVKLDEQNRNVTDVLRQLMLPTPSGQLVPLTTIARIDYTGSIGDISRINHERTVTVKASVDEEKVPGAVARAQAEELLKEFSLPAGYRLQFTGEFESQKEAEEFLSRAFLIAVFCIFLILVTLFNSVSQPTIIMTSVILSLGGAFLGLLIFKSPFGIIMSGVGVISLAGVVVNNAIVLIDYTNKLREGGMALNDAVIAAGATRLRPVLLTAVTTVLGLLPMVTGISYDFHVMAISWISESSQWWRNMAVVVIFGLLVATFLTLVVVPSLYSLLATGSQRLSRMLRAIRRAYWWPYEKLSGERVVIGE